jgi:hypothetical protein
MESYKRVSEIIDVNLIYCLIPIILTLILVELIFKNRFETKKVLNIVRWTIIIYTIITWTITLFGIILDPTDSIVVNRATGPYKIAYWIMFFSALILPFSLLVKRLGAKFWYVLIVAFCMKMGVYFERYVIISTSFHRDYLPENANPDYMGLLLFGVGLIFLQGIVIALLALGLLEMIKRKKAIHNSMYKL